MLGHSIVWAWLVFSCISVVESARGPQNVVPLFDKAQCPTILLSQVHFAKTPVLELYNYGDVEVDLGGFCVFAVYFCLLFLSSFFCPINHSSHG